MSCVRLLIPIFICFGVVWYGVMMKEREGKGGQKEKRFVGTRNEEVDYLCKREMKRRKRKTWMKVNGKEHIYRTYE